MGILKDAVDKELLEALGIPNAKFIHGEVKPTPISPSVPGCPEELPEETSLIDFARLLNQGKE